MTQAADRTTSGSPGVAPADAIELLGKLALFAEATSDDLETIATFVDWVTYRAGEVLFEQGDDGDAIYLVVRGRLRIVADGHPIGEVGRGGLIGELALLGSTTRTATAEAIRDTLVARLPANRARDLALASPPIGLGLARIAAERAVRGRERAAAPPRCLAVVSLDRGTQRSELADELADRFRSQGVVAHLGVEVLDRWMDDSDPELTVQRLTEVEDDHDVVVADLDLHRDGDDATITALLRQMDIVVAQLEAGRAPDQQVLDQLTRAGRPVWLVIVHTTLAAPRRTSELLSRLATACEVQDHTHVRAGAAGDLDRLARELLGQSIGLVLGGGGSRGFGHIGVLRALNELGVPIDRIGGSSMGAVIAAQVAMGRTPEELLERNARAWSRRSIVEVGLPTVSLLSGRRFAGVIDSLLGDRQIEDLELDYFCTTVDLSTFSLHVARTGPVAIWARASASVPGLFPPVVDEHGHLHVDGGTLDNVPTDIMRSAGVGTVVGVDVCHRQTAMVLDRDRECATGVRLFASRVQGSWSPSIIDVINRASMLGALQTHAKAREHADVYLMPPVGDEGFAAFERIAHLADIGYRHTIEALAEDETLQSRLQP